MDSKIETKTEVISTESLDDILGIPGAESVITGEEANTTEKEEDKKPTVFTNANPDINIPAPGEEEEEPTEEPEEPSKIPSNPEEILDEITSMEDGESTTTKDELISLTKSLIEDGTILPFDDDEKQLEDYSLDDIKELIKLNIEERENMVREKVPQEFFEALPKELQYAAKYVADGGTDLKGLFKTLAEVEEIKSIDPSTEEGAEQIVREYLRATNFGSDEDIQEEIETWKDLGKLEEKAGKFKPKLDNMREQIVQQKIKKQEEIKKQQIKAAEAYTENIYKTLEKGKINDIQLTPETQQFLYDGLTKPAYPSITGKQTNLFGHLIEKYQFVEPNHDLIAEALWLLADPEGYKSQLRQNAVNETVEKTVRKLKTEQSNKNSVIVEPENNKVGKKPAIKKRKNFFARN